MKEDSTHSLTNLGEDEIPSVEPFAGANCGWIYVQSMKKKVMYSPSHGMLVPAKMP